MSPTEEVLCFVMNDAQRISSQLYHECIDPAHVLLALLNTPRCPAYSLLLDLNVHPSQVSLEIGRRMPPAPYWVNGIWLPLTRDVLEIWRRIPEMMRSEYRDCSVTVALLIAIAQQTSTTAATILAEFGVTEEKIRQAVLATSPSVS